MFVTAAANFTDQNPQDTHTAVWTWGDGAMTAGVVTEQDGVGAISGQHAYATPGMYTLKVRVTDNQGGAGEATYQFIIVYDPNGGFVTGGGWIVSPAGACRLTPACQTATGKANFSFNAKYLPRAATPSGAAQFDFKAGGLDFRATGYAWLVVNGQTARFTGEGTLNGRGRYGFLFSVVDGQPGGRLRSDLIRIKIWDKDAANRVIYDSQMATPEAAEPALAIGGGSIVTHEK